MFTDKNWSDIINTAVSAVVKSPKLLFIIVSGRASGELWMYMYLAYYKKAARNNQYINNNTGKTVIGLAWMSLIFLPSYYISYGIHQFTEESVLDLAVTVVIYSIVFELVVFLVTVKVKAPR